MVTMSIGAGGRATAALAWQRYVEPDLWPTWSPQISWVQTADKTIRAGTVGVVHAVLGVQVDFEVTDFDVAHKSWAWTAVLPLSIRLRLRHTVEERPNGCYTGLRVTGPLPIVLGYLPVAWVALARLVRP